MKENGEKFTWEEIAAKIKCPIDSLCKKNEGITTSQKRIENDTVIYVAKCHSCGKGAMEWGYDQFSFNLRPNGL